jgi:heme exporter protein A
VNAPIGLDVEGLSLWRGERALFRDLAFSLRAGHVLVLEGPNGAGKTTLLRAIAGFIEPHEGTIRIALNNGQRIDNGEERGRYIGWLGHQDGIKLQMTPQETLGFYEALYGGPRKASGALEQTGLARVRELPAQFLSAGQKRRLALARLSQSARPIWLLDEPLSALDAAGKSLVTNMIAEHCRAGGMCIAATHDPLALDCTRLGLGTP